MIIVFILIFMRIRFFFYGYWLVILYLIVLWFVKEKYLWWFFSLEEKKWVFKLDIKILFFKRVFFLENVKKRLNWLVLKYGGKV